MKTPAGPSTGNSAGLAGRRALLLLRLLVTAGLCLWLWRAAPDLSLLWGVWASWPLLLGALGCAVLVQLLSAWRWNLILRARGQGLSAAEAQEVCWIASFFNQALLGTLGGDAYRAARIRRRHGAGLGSLLEGLLLDRLSGIWAALLLALLCWPLLAARADLHEVLRGWLFGISAAVLVLGLAGVIWLRRPGAGLGRSLLPLLLSGLLCQALVVLVHLCLCWALFPDADCPVALLFVLVPIALCAIALPVNPPGAVGTAEAIYQFLFALVGLADGAILALLLRLVLLLQCLPGAWLWLRARHRR